jgi:hypothetical protein
MEIASAGNWLEDVIGESRDAQTIAGAIASSPQFRKIVEDAVAAAGNGAPAPPKRQTRLRAEGIAVRIHRSFPSFSTMHG